MTFTSQQAMGFQNIACFCMVFSLVKNHRFL